LGSVVRRLFLAGFWIGLCAAVIGAVVLERRQIQRHDAAIVAAQQEIAAPVAMPDQVNIAEYANAAGRSRVSRMPSPKVEAEGFTVQKDVAYGNDARQKLDVYSPNEPREDRKVVLFVHGGGLISGSKDEYRFVGEAMAVRGFTTILPNYRLAPDVQFPVFIRDVAQAVRWAADRYGTNKIFLMGHSAGGYIVSMLAANTHFLKDAGVDRTKLPGVIALAGEYDVLPLTNPERLGRFGAFKDDPTIEPKMFAKLPLPPLLLLHGASDSTVRPQNSEHLAAAWARVGGEVDLKFYSKVAHMQIVESLGDTMPVRAPTRDDVISFVDQH
jgi:acetyl esterase/lipase